MVWTFVADFTPIYTITNSLIVLKCPTNGVHSTFLTFSFIIVFVALLVLVVLAASTRSAPANFRESLWLGACIYTVSIMLIFFIPMSLIPNFNINVIRGTGIICAIIVVHVILFFLFWIKFLVIWFLDFKKKITIGII